MLRHNLLLTLRNFRKHKSSFFINLIGLSTGLAAALMIYMWVDDELHFDKFHEKDARLYSVMEQLNYPEGTKISDESSGTIAEALVTETPDVEYAVAVAPSSWFQKFTLSVGTNNIKAVGQYVGKDYLSVFSFPLIDGDPQKVLADKNSIVISRNLAMRLFNTTDNLIGKPIEFQHEREFFISGVLENIPVNSSEQFEFLLSFDYYKDVQSWVNSWGSIGPHVYLVLKDGADPIQFNKKIADLIERHTQSGFRSAFVLQYSDIYLHHTFDHGSRTGGRIEYVRLFSLVAVFILGIACINFMNLSTAKATRRVKEVGIKKAIGAARRQLIFQYLSESVLLTFMSVVVALIVVVLLLPGFNELTGKALALRPTTDLITALLAITSVTGLVSGSYPALYLSGFDPAKVLKGKLPASFSEVLARKGLVVFQFTLSVILIVAVLVVYKQIDYIQNSNLGYDKDNIIRFDSEGKVLGTQETFTAALKQIPGVVNAAGSYHNIVGRNFSSGNISWPGKNEKEVVLFEGMVGDYELLNTLGMKVIEGRNFSRDFGNQQDGIIFNEAAINLMGIQDPIGKTVMYSDKPVQIIGVLKDFHFMSLHESVGPMFYRVESTSNNAWYKILIKLEAGHERETIKRIEDFYKTYNPGFILDYAFLDQAFQKQYVSETRVATLSQYFAILAIVISCLGLFGLTAFTAERRLKEIGIRKILGSGNASIVYLLSSDFTKMIITAIIIAIPVSYYVASSWLGTFAYRIDLKIWFFAGAGLLTLLIGWLTVAFQIIKASRINPVQSLRSE